VLDPVDGTRAFLCGAPTWGVLIALADAHGGPRFGLIDQPFTGERFAGGFGVAEWRRGDAVRPLGVRGTERLSEALIMTTFPEVGTPADGQAFQRLARPMPADPLWSRLLCLCAAGAGPDRSGGGGGAESL
jgi:fructose-1,6-bisphosphatase/inositol monophosphatase family enzyme